MTTTTITTAVDALNAARETLTGLQQQRDRAEAAASVGDTAAAEIASLGQQRGATVGNAFLTGATPDTSAIDKAIAAAEKKSADSRALAAAARNALDILGPQIAQAKADVDAAERAALMAARDDATERFSNAVQGYNAAAQSMVAALVEVAAASQCVAALGGRNATGVEAIGAVLVRDTKVLNERGQLGWVPFGGGEIYGPAMQKVRDHMEQISAAGVPIERAHEAPTAQQPTQAAESRGVTIAVVGEPQVTTVDEPAVGLVESVIR